MNIIVSEIPPEGLSVEFSRDDGWFRRQAPVEILNRFHAESILFSCTASRMGRQVAIKGSVQLRLAAFCTRCLEPVNLSLKGDFFYTMNPEISREDGGQEIELSANDLEVGFYDNDRIELEPIVTEQVFLQLPIRTICGEGCRGLCPACGNNLNRNACEHTVTMKAESPFAVLKNFKVTRKRS